MIVENRNNHDNIIWESLQKLWVRPRCIFRFKYEYEVSILLFDKTKIFLKMFACPKDRTIVLKFSGERLQN